MFLSAFPKKLVDKRAWLMDQYYAAVCAQMELE